MHKIVIIAVAVLLIGHSEAKAFFGSYEYIPEVGYHDNGKENWWLGDRYKSKESCINSATSQYNFYNKNDQKRAFSWACRKMEGDKFLDRVR